MPDDEVQQRRAANRTVISTAASQADTESRQGAITVVDIRRTSFGLFYRLQDRFDDLLTALDSTALTDTNLSQHLILVPVSRNKRSEMWAAFGDDPPPQGRGREAIYALIARALGRDPALNTAESEDGERVGGLWGYSHTKQHFILAINLNGDSTVNVLVFPNDTEFVPGLNYRLDGPALAKNPVDRLDLLGSNGTPEIVSLPFLVETAAELSANGAQCARLEGRAADAQLAPRSMEALAARQPPGNAGGGLRSGRGAFAPGAGSLSGLRNRPGQPGQHFIGVDALLQQGNAGQTQPTSSTQPPTAAADPPTPLHSATAPQRATGNISGQGDTDSILALVRATGQAASARTTEPSLQDQVAAIGLGNARLVSMSGSGSHANRGQSSLLAARYLDSLVSCHTPEGHGLLETILLESTHFNLAQLVLLAVWHKLGTLVNVFGLFDTATELDDRIAATTSTAVPAGLRILAAATRERATAVMEAVAQGHATDASALDLARGDTAAFLRHPAPSERPGSPAGPPADTDTLIRRANNLLGALNAIGDSNHARQAQRIVAQVDNVLRHQFESKAVADWALYALGAPQVHAVNVMRARRALVPTELAMNFLGHADGAACYGTSLSVGDTTRGRAMAARHLPPSKLLTRSAPSTPPRTTPTRGPKARQTVPIISGADCVTGVRKLGNTHVNSSPRQDDGNPMVFMAIACKCCGDKLAPSAGGKPDCRHTKGSAGVLHFKILFSNAARSPSTKANPGNYIVGQPSLAQYKCAGLEHMLGHGTPALAAGAGVNAPQ